MIRSQIPAIAWLSILFGIGLVLAATLPAFGDGVSKPEALPGPLPDPSARLLGGDDASEYWTLFVELDSGHRISQRFLLTNAGPGEHTAVAVGHLMEPGRPPYRYENGRRRSRWTLSDDRLFFDIAASHLDLHRPRGQLLITKDDIEIRLHFDFAPSDLATEIPRRRLPAGYAIDILAVAAPTSGSIHAPWMPAPLETTGRTWMAHTWTTRAEAELLDRRVDVYAADGTRAFYGIQLHRAGGYSDAFALGRNAARQIIESSINIDTNASANDAARARWTERAGPAGRSGSKSYPIPGGFDVSGPRSGRISLTREWLRFDPLDVIPNPFRWFIRRVTQPQEVWADAEIDVTLWAASGDLSHPPPDAIAGGSAEQPGASGHEEDRTTDRKSSPSDRTTEEGSATSSVTGVASITFLNPVDRR